MKKIHYLFPISLLLLVSCNITNHAGILSLNKSDRLLSEQEIIKSSTNHMETNYLNSNHVAIASLEKCIGPTLRFQNENKVIKYVNNIRINKEISNTFKNNRCLKFSSDHITNSDNRIKRTIPISVFKRTRSQMSTNYSSNGLRVLGWLLLIIGLVVLLVISAIVGLVLMIVGLILVLDNRKPGESETEQEK